MIATDVIRELGDPDKLCGFENHVVLQFGEPWPGTRKSALPRSLHLEDGGHRITTTAESFLENSEILCGFHVVAAAFAGCAAFDSSGPLVSAAQTVLAKARTLVIVHNRDHIGNLVDWFRSVDVIVLHHDLRLHILPEGWTCPQGPIRPQLKRLIGSAPGLGAQKLFVGPATILALVPCCSQLSEVQTAMHEVLDPKYPSLRLMLASYPPFLTSSSLALGWNLERLDGGTKSIPGTDVTPALMTRARKLFPRIRHLEVATKHLESVAQIRNFADVTDLSLTYEGRIPLMFGRLLEDVLTQLRLKHLSLKFVADVSLSSIARHWPDMKSLSLWGCHITNEEEILPGSLKGLVNLGLSIRNQNMELQNQAVDALLKVATKLETLRLDEVLCKYFVVRCRNEPLQNLQRLTLVTDESLPAMGLTGEDVRCLVKALPALRYAATDSYDLRLFFQHYMPSVTLDWCRCTTCVAEFPRLSDDQSDTWRDFMFKM